MTSTPTKTPNMRDRMPHTAAFVDQKRKEWGADHVRECLQRAMRGETGWFYAMEAGATLGTPFGPADLGTPFGPADLGAVKGTPVADMQRLAVMIGSPFAAFIRAPDVVQTSAPGGAA